MRLLWRRNKQAEIIINDRSDKTVAFILISLAILCYWFLSNKTRLEVAFLISLIWYFAGVFYLAHVKVFSGLGIYIIYMFIYVQSGFLMQGYYSYYTYFESKTLCVVIAYNILAPIVLMLLRPSLNIKRTKLRQNSIRKEWVWILFIVGVIAGLFYFLSVGSIPLFNEDAENYRVQAISGRGSIFIIANTCFQVANAVARDRKQRVIIFVIGGSILAGSGFRSQVLSLILVAFLVTWIGHGKKYFATGTITMSLIFVLYALLGFYRSDTSYAVRNIWMPVLWRFFVNSDNFNRIVVGYPTSAYQYGLSLLNDLLVLLPGSQQTFMMKLKDILAYNFPGGSMTPSVFGEGYYNWGSIGAVAWPILTLILVAFIDRWSKDRFSGGMYFLIAFSFAGFSVSCLVPSAINGVIPYMLLYIVLEYFSKRFRINLGSR